MSVTHQRLYKLRTDCFLPLTWSHFEFSDPSARLTLIPQYISISLELPKFINMIKEKIYVWWVLSFTNCSLCYNIRNINKLIILFLNYPLILPSQINTPRFSDKIRNVCSSASFIIIDSKKVLWPSNTDQGGYRFPLQMKHPNRACVEITYKMTE